MRLPAVAAILVIALALFGCSSPQQAAQRGQEAPLPPDAGTRSAGASASAEGKASIGADGLDAEDAAEEAPGGMLPGPEDSGYEYGDLAFSELTALGVPLECDITYAYAGREILSKAFLNGTDELRVESPAGLSQCAETITVVRSGRAYISCRGKQAMASCDWLREEYGTAGRTSAFDFTALGPGAMLCRDWAYDAEFFRTPGEVCHLG